MTSFYIICVIISILFLLWFLSLGEQHSTLQTLLLVTAVISNFGHLSIAISKDLGHALFGLKLTYVGGCFLPLIMFLIIAKTCHLKIPKFLVGLMASLQILIFGLVCTIGYLPIYYKSAELITVDGLSIIEKEYAMLHAIHPISLYMYVIAGSVICIVSLGRKTVVSYRNVLKLLLALIIGVFVYLGERIMGIKVEILPLVYSIQMVLVVTPMIRNNTFSINANAIDVFGEYSNVGYVVFDKKMRYMGCNDRALSVFPELLKYRLEYVLKDKKTTFTDLLLSPIREASRMKEKGILKTDIFPLNDKFYEYRIATIVKGRRKAGIVLEITDVTLRQKSIELIENYNKNLQAEVESQTKKIREIRDKTMLGMAQMVESRDLSTGGHIRRTSVVVSIFAKELLKTDLGLTEEFLKDVERSAPMHDLGKIAVDDAVLRKQGKFTDEEYTKMKEHAAAGAEIVSKILTDIEDPEFVKIAINVAHYHHEKYDGNGYPDKLSGEDIPIEARIMAYADVFDALVSKRCYKEAFDYEKAFGIIRDSIGTHFDPKLADAFMACRSELEEFYSTQQ